MKHTGGDGIVLLLYADDIVLIRSNDDVVQTVISQLTQEFDMNDLGILHFFLRLQIQYDTQGLFVHQTKYIKELLQKANMVDCKPCHTPCHPNHKLLNHGSHPVTDPSYYRSLVGALQYLTFTQPHIAFSVNQVCQSAS